MNSQPVQPISLTCPECGRLLEAKTQAAADLVRGCVDHPTPNVLYAGAAGLRCIEVGKFGRCELTDMHRSLHQATKPDGELVTWFRYDKWNPYCKEEAVEMGAPKDD
jgi:hypothetical protein